MFYKDNHNREKQLRFSIRKVSFGAASVAVATLLMFLGNGVVEASEQQNSTNEAILGVTRANRDESISTDSKIKEGNKEADKKNSVEENKQPLAKSESEKENRESEIPTDTPTTLNTETNQEKPAVLKRVRRSNPDSGMDSSTTNDDPSANKVFEAPAEGASLDELKAKLNELEDSVENNDKIRDMDTVGNSKQVEKGTVNEINEFGGWKAVTDNGETGKFAIARKTEGGVFPLETVNTVRTIKGNYEYYYDTYVREQAFDRTGDYMLFLSKVRTLADQEEPTFDGQPYKENNEGSGIAKGVKGFNGIEKTFKAYSSETGSTVKISFKTGYSGDINGGKAKYKVEVMIDENGVKKTIYTKTFSPTDNKKDDDAIITPAKDGNKREYLRNEYNNKTLDKKQVEAQMAEEANKPNGTPGTFTSKNIVLPKGVTDYTVRISSADNQHLGMGYQSPHNHYALPISGLEFSISQDTSNLAKNLLQRIYNKLKETESTDKSQKTGDTASNYENKLNEIDALLKSSDLKTTAEYKRLSLDLLNAKEQLKEVTPDAPAVAVDSDKAQVTVTPSNNADRLEVSVGNDKVVATKTGSTWSLATPKEGVSIDANTGVVTVAHNAADANTVISATAKHGNSDLSSAANGNLPAKEVTPDAPVVAVDSDKAQVTVTPSNNADRLEVSVGNDKVVATKTGSTWSLATPKEGVSIDANTGVVTVAHNAADANTVISATAKHGNSDLSSSANGNLPAKEVTPDAPVVAVDSDKAQVTVTPSNNADRLEVSVGNDKVVATKTGSTWSLATPKEGVSIDANTGVVTVAHNAADANTVISATAKHGNSDLSSSANGNLPAKEVTPDAPVVAVDSDKAQVTVTPSNNADRLEVSVGNDKVVATKTGSTWSLATPKEGVSIDANTGVVTVAHNAADANTVISATAKHGNSDLSSSANGNLPAKEVTPDAPAVAVDSDKAQVTVTPSNNADRLEVSVGNDKVVATKTGSTWSLATPKEGVSIDANTGVVTVAHNAADANTVISATAKHGNSDLSSAANGNLPAKEVTPDAPVVAVDSDKAQVTVTPSNNADRLEVSVGNDKVVATKTGSTWSLATPKEGVSIDANTGVVTVAHNAADANTVISATAKHGNSDLSSSANGNLPAKEVTPDAPVVAVDSDKAQVTVTPSSTADRLEVSVGNDKVVATKTGSTWSLATPKEGVSIDANTGVVTVAHNAADANTVISATAKHGNSDLSSAANGNLPAKEVTPDAPVVAVDSDKAQVTVTPSNNADRLEVSVGNDKVVATKTGSTWSLATPKEGVSIDANTGVVTVAHNAADANTVISATAKHGNSDLSSSANGNLPAKEVTPDAPAVAVDSDKAQVTVTPSNNADRLEVSVGNDKVVATKTGSTWSLATPKEGVRIDANTGVVTVAHNAADANTVISATAKHGNSDLSSSANGNLPAKEVTPDAPVVAVDSDKAQVTVTPSNNADRLEVSVGNDKVVATKTGSTWSLATPKEGVSIDANTGVVTVAHNAADANTVISATAKHGNSDLSSSANGNLPAKEVTPDAPAVAVDSDKAQVTVTPSNNADRLEVSVGNDKVVATKTGSTWSLAIPKEGVSIDANTGVVTVAHNAADANTVISATAKHGNSDLSSSANGNLPAKEVTPDAPVVAVDSDKAQVTVTPSANADRLEVSVGNDKVVATKTGSTWSLATPKEGVSIDANTGVVTVAHNAADANTVISATAKHGNSDLSSSANGNLPAKEVTPDAPVVAVDSDKAQVTVTPSANADRLEVSVGNDKVVATKTGSTWSLATPKEGVSIDANTGVVTVAHNAADANTVISATAKHGNSDLSSSANGNLPAKEVTPDAPVVAVDSDKAQVTVTPSNNADRLEVSVGNDKVVATKTGSTWSLATPKEGVSIDANTGVVTVAHNAADANTVISATAKHGNSDLSSSANGNLPAKEVTPDAPAVAVDSDKAQVTVTPSNNADRLEVSVGNDKVVATKTGSTWSLATPKEGVSIDANTGVVTVAHNAADANTVISATAKHGNSDLSSSANGNLPAKEVTPDAPAVAVDSDKAQVTVTPSNNADRLEVSVGNDKVVATKTGSTWSLATPKEGVSIDANTGVVTVAHNAADANTVISATAKHGNSDLSSAANGNLPAKEVTPDAPAVAVDSDKAQVTVTPSSTADRLEVSVGNDKVVATKTGSTWSLATPKEGVSIDANTGVVTVAHNAADANTVISATAKHGNSDLSSSANGNLPAKEVTPDAPAVAVDSDKAQVTVTPSNNADRLEVSVGNDKVVATKTGSTWSLATPKEGVSIDANTGVVTVAHNAADANTVISATAKHGNSDLSSSANGNLPAKEVTPDAPVVAVDSDKAQVTVTPSANADRLEVSVGNDKVVATKTGSTWSLATPKEGVSIDANTGVVTVAHNAADANTVISATAKHGNSDLSAENSAQMPSIKPLALADVERISNESIADIDKDPDLKEYEKNVAKEKVRKELAVAKEAIKNARNNAGVESIIRNFVYKILGAVLPITDYDLNSLLVKGTVQVYLGETLYEEKIKEKIVLEKDVQVSRIIYPDTHSLGQKFAKVTLKLPDNSTIEINVPVEVVAFQGGNSGVPSSMQQGQNNSKIPQKPQEQARTSQIQQDNPQTSPQPSPGQELPPTRPVEIPIKEGGSKNQSFTTQVDRNKLPNTGSTDSTAMLIVGTASALLGIGLTGRRRKED